VPPLNPAAGSLWRSLEEAARDPAFLARAAQEFPGLTASLDSGMDRRQVIRLMGAALMMAAMTGCDSRFGADLVPAVRMPPNIIPALPNFYATAHVLGGYAFGVVVKHLMGRPVQVQGNPHHPASLGALDVFAQAQVLDFYDPDRASGLSVGGEPTDRQALEAALRSQRELLAARHGAGLRVLTGTVASHTLRARIEALLTQYPNARWTQWEPLSREGPRRGAVLAYGRPVDVIAHLDAVDVLVSIDGDLLSSNPGRLHYARDFASRRNPARGGSMSRVYAIESTPTALGSVADHRIVAGPARLQQIVAVMAGGLLRDPAAVSDPHPERAPWLHAMIEDLRSARGRALVHVGADQPAELHALAHRINEALGGRGKTFDLIDEVAPPAAGEQAQTLEDLSSDMQDGKVAHLLILDSNPAFTAPAAWGFADALKRVPFSISLARNADETAGETTWYVPQAHQWETWSDARAYDGTATVLQPQALPLYGGMSAHDLLGLYLTQEPVSAEEAVQATWRRHFGNDFPGTWRSALASGVVPGTASTSIDVPLLPTSGIEPVPPATQQLTVLFRADPSLWDGRYANNPWLQELPRPLTKIVWDNPLLIAPKLARTLQLANGDLARLSVGDRSVLAPVWLMPGHAPDCVTAFLGSGRRAAGSIGNGHGVNFYPLTGPLAGPRGSSSAAVTLRKVAGRAELASTEHHNLLLETPAEILRHGTLAQFTANPHFAANAPTQPRLYRREPPGPAAWGMSIDLNACIGCNACTIACQAENNIAVVGKDQVIAQREMHWLRVDRYYAGEADAPETFFEPVMCMHCEEAPCELVCPVGATVHDAEGLNVMVYNRCVGTRFCSNNCPYKVRRFNFKGYAHEQLRPPQSWNPDVTVRARGVMEKCSYCLQRIAEARIEADRENRPLGEVKTACQSACPTQAITFGNLNDPASQVAQRKQSPLNFAMLESQGTRPRTTYEAVVRNPHPAIPPAFLDESA
jgi:molybdopterin-containing oxidoreductase family iron-sulfur binding subunit